MKGFFTIEIHTIHSSLLSYKNKLFNSIFRKIFSSFNKSFHWSTSIIASECRNCAISATLIAPFSNLKIFHIWSFSNDTWSIYLGSLTYIFKKCHLFFPSLKSFNHLNNIFKSSSPYKSIYFRKFFCHFIFISFSKTTCCNKIFKPSFF